jgi:pyruvate formate lyase activating enzyme
MLIGGLQKTTLIDYPDKVAATIFTIGCNFRCSFCHNPDIVKGIARVIAVDDVLSFLKGRRKLIDAVCITGGEPTVQSGLKSFIKKVKEMGFLVKLDTNGSHPEVVEKLLAEKLLDYIAMDIKSTWKKYSKVTCRKLDLDNFKKSVTIIKESGLPHEFRSTVLPALHSPEDILEMAKQVKGADKYFLQQFLAAKKLVNPSFVVEATYTKKELNEILQGFKDWFNVCKVR